MPIYLYRCDSCEQNHEALQKVGDAPLQTCPHCGADRMRKVIAPVGIIFKGSGFHKNDYTGGGGGGKKAETSEKSSSGEGKGESKGESTPASTSSGDGGGASDKPSSQADKVA